MVFKGVEPSVAISTKDINSYIFDAPAYDVNKPVFLDASNAARTFTFKQARTLVRQLAAGFRKAGLKRGDCVCVQAFNDISYTVIFLGILAAGGVFAGTNPAYTQYELSHVIKLTKAKFIIVEPELLKPLLLATKEARIPQDRVFIYDTLGQAIPEGFSSWQKLLQHGEEDWIRFDDAETSKNTVAALFTSSGTTGLPKACRNTHYNLIAQDVLVHACDPRPYPVRRIVATPLFHAAIAPFAFVTALKNGFQSWVMRRFDLEGYLSTFEKNQITELGIVPPIAIAIIMSPLSKKYSLKSCRAGFCGAAPMEKALQKRLHNLIPDSVFGQAWGMTETSCIGFDFPWPESDDTGSIGRLLTGLEAKIIDDDGNDISAYNVQGELCIRGPTVIPGYFENDAANKEGFDPDGWLKTGDIVHCDSQGRWYIADRKKELIKVRGFQVPPPELESVIMSHPDVVDAAVIGVTFTPEQGEVPRAYVVRRSSPGGSALTETAIKEHTQTRLASFKRLDGGVVFLDEVPKTASGKILKRLLRERAKKEIQEGTLKARL